MLRLSVRVGLLALPALLACDLSAPVWNADLFFPVDYPDVELSPFGISGQIPPVDLAFSTGTEQQDITGLIEELLSDQVNTLTVEVITQADIDVTANLTLIIGATPAALLDPDASVRVQLAASQALDTAVIQVDPDLLRGAIALYYQTDGSLRGRAGGTPVAPGDVIRIDVNLLANYQVSQ
jgi:hypothetical protein